MQTENESMEYRCPDGFLMPAHLIRPRSPGQFPALILVHEAFGLNDEMKRIAREIAAGGYALVIPDLFARGNWLGCIRRLVTDLSRDDGRASNDLLAARTWLREQHFVAPERIGVLGLCIGGGFAMLLAKTGLFRAAANFYGPAPESLDGTCPVMASFGAKDRIMTPHAAGIAAELGRLGVPHDLKVYPNVGHGFMNRPPNRLLGLASRYSPVRAGYDRDAAADAMTRLKEFLSIRL
jgi:carboxymethylenebutenolidase